VNKAPASASKSYGRPFLEIFKEVGYDFYKIDPGLFAPAVIVVNNAETGKIFRTGSLSIEVFKRSIGL
jgi:methenyltetrahydromethanopterin cyclohydrolase